ncbi:hypothetical protein MY9_2918 [Bacillus sp. JS]|nr:hypothetical protein MY9_2918 [Bacillus sp. JS]
MFLLETGLIMKKEMDRNEKEVIACLLFTCKYIAGTAC